MKPPEHLSARAIKSLFWIILTALLGIVLLSLVGSLLRAGVFGMGGQDGFTSADEALSVLGNIASAAVGGLVGWLTRDLVVTNAKTGEKTTVPTSDTAEN